MTVLTLDRLWINLISTGDAVSAYSADRAGAYTNIGEVKHLAGGRQASVSAVGEAGTYSFTMVDVPTASVDILRSWKGQAVQVRNNRGQLFNGTYFQVSPGEVSDRLTSYNVSITLQVVSVEQGV
jgi:hypothetical protein